MSFARSPTSYGCGLARNPFKGGIRFIKATIWAALAATTALCAAQSSAFAAGEPYLIGLIAGTTGAYGSTGAAPINGAQMSVDKINASGGALGRQLKLDPHNDDASATVSGQLYEKLIAAGVIAIAGSPDTGPVTAQLAIRHKFPAIGRRRRRRPYHQHQRAERSAESRGVRLRPQHLRLRRRLKQPL